MIFFYSGLHCYTLWKTMIEFANIVKLCLLSKGVSFTYALSYMTLTPANSAFGQRKAKQEYAAIEMAKTMRHILTWPLNPNFKHRMRYPTNQAANKSSGNQYSTSYENQSKQKQNIVIKCAWVGVVGGSNIPFWGSEKTRNVSSVL